MAQEVKLMGATYSGVPSVLLPDSNGTMHSFDDTSDATATASDISTGKTAYVNGVKLTGTNSGGGGSEWELISHTTMDVSTTSTSAGSAGTVGLGSSSFTSSDVLWVHIRGKSGKRAGYFYGSDAILVNPNPKNGSTSTFSACAIEYIRVSSSDIYSVMTGSYGVYPYTITSSGTLTIRRRYSQNYSLTIDDTFDVYVYKLSLPTGLSLFE